MHGIDCHSPVKTGRCRAPLKPHNTLNWFYIIKPDVVREGSVIGIRARAAEKSLNGIILIRIHRISVNHPGTPLIFSNQPVKLILELEWNPNRIDDQGVAPIGNLLEFNMRFCIGSTMKKSIEHPLGRVCITRARSPVSG